MTQVRLMGL